jgi:hypothetical protein
VSTNPRDPLLQTGPEKQRALFDAYVEVSRGFPTEDVIGATMNLLVNALRQAHGNRRQADERMSEVSQRLRSILMEHYDPVTGRRRSIFPFTQVVEMPRFDDNLRKNRTS